jgi:hypothetical protein
MPNYKKEYGWGEVKRCLADSEARPSPFTFTLATARYAADKANYDNAVLNYAADKAKYDLDFANAKAAFLKDLQEAKAKTPGGKIPKGTGPTFVAPLAPAKPGAAPDPVDRDNFLGHADSKHGTVSDQSLQNRSATIGTASAFSKQADVQTGGAPLVVVTKDQSILIRQILNSNLGQAALGALDAATSPARLAIVRVDPLDVQMRVAKGGTAPVKCSIAKAMLIVDSGAANLHIVTCFPFDELVPGGSKFSADSSYELTTIVHNAESSAPAVRWSNQSDSAIVGGAKQLW